MADTLRIQLTALGPAAFLESAGGEVVTSGGDTFLKGKFRLIVAETPSDDIDFDPAGTRAAVVMENGSWRLRRLAKTTFTFTTPLRLQDSPDGPWLECSAGWVIQPSASAAMPLLSLQESRVSLDGGAVGPDIGKLLFHTQTGNKTINLTPSKHPEDPAWTGFFVLPFEDGHAVSLGSVSELIKIDHAIQAEVIVTGKADLRFRIPPPASEASALFFTATDPQALRIRCTATSGLMMAVRGDATKWSRLDVSVRRLEAVGGWLRGTQLIPDDLWLGHVSDANTPVTGSTSVFTATERLTWEQSLPRTGGAAGTPKCRMIYRAPAKARLTKEGDRRARFYGLRVQGLGSRSGAQAILDPDLAVFDLDPDENGTALFLPKSGGDIPIGNGTERSFLVPKPNPRDPSGERVLEVPVAHEMTLRASSTETPTSTTLRLAKDLLTLVTPRLVSAPVGIASTTPSTASTASLARWKLGLPEDLTELEFDLTADALRPRGGEGWLNPFKTLNPSESFGLIEHPGARIVVDGSSAPRALKGTAVEKPRQTEVTTIKPGGKEIVAYSAFFTVLSWATVRCFAQGLEACLDEKQFKVSFPELTEDSFKEYVKNNGLKDLRVVYFAEENGPHTPGAIRGIHDFIDDNISTVGRRPAKFHWAFTMGLSVLLFERDEETGAERYCDEIIKLRKASAQAGLAFDFSAETSIEPTHLGWSEAQWKAMIEESPVLWPRGSGRNGARLDPSDRQWRGTLFRDMPLFLPAPPIVGSEFPFLQRLIDSINKRLVLDYGWRDESGPTWVGGLHNEDPGDLFTPGSWNGMLQMFLMQVRMKGAAGAIVTAEGTCRIRLPRIKKKNSDDVLELVGTFGLDLESGKSPITRIEISQDGHPLETDSIPGFTKVALRRIATDLKTAQAELLLTATPELANALPFLSSERPQQAFLAFDFGSDPSLTMSLALPSEVQTNLFGRWPLAVQAMSIAFSEDQNDPSVELRVRGRLNLGFTSIGSIGAEVVVKRDAAGTIDLDVEIQEIGGELSVGLLDIKASLKWATKDGESGFVRLTNAGQAGKERELWGTLEIKDPGLLGESKLAIRIGSRGEASYWISSIETSAKIPFGIGELRSPALLLGHRVDLQGGLSKAVADPTGPVLALLRPPAGQLNDWLAKWEPSSEVGTVVAGSGYLHFQDQVASAPVKDDKIDPTKLSSLIFTDSGLVRVDGVAAMLDAVTLRFGVAIDFKKKRITAGLQAPTIKIPPDDPEYEIQAGYILIGASLADTDRYLRVSIGWPERIGDTEFERDWTKATKIYMRSMFPINTVWGGYLAELTGDHVTFGFAFRAGWTWSYSVGGGVAKGTAELGITLGGVFQFSIAWGGRDSRVLAGDMPLLANTPFALPGAEEFPPLLLQSAALSTHAKVIAAAMASTEESLLLMASLDLKMTAEIFGDIWGKASVEFLGVTLVAISVRAYARFRVCGTLRRGITQAKGTVGFEVSVTILCVTYKTDAQIDIILVDGDCPLLLSLDRMILPGELPAVLATSSIPSRVLAA